MSVPYPPKVDNDRRDMPPRGISVPLNDMMKYREIHDMNTFMLSRTKPWPPFHCTVIRIIKTKKNNFQLYIKQNDGLTHKVYPVRELFPLIREGKISKMTNLLIKKYTTTYLLETRKVVMIILDVEVV